MTDHSSIDPLSHALGGIETQLKMIANAQAEDRIAAASYRTDVRREIKEMREDVHDVQDKVKSVTGDVGKLSPKVEALEAQRLMTVGAARFAIVLSKAAHIISALLGGALAMALDRWLGK